MFIISIPEKRLPKNSTNFQKILLENSKPNYCPGYIYMGGIGQDVKKAKNMGFLPFVLWVS